MNLNKQLKPYKNSKLKYNFGWVVTVLIDDTMSIMSRCVFFQTISYLPTQDRTIGRLQTSVTFSVGVDTHVSPKNC